MRGGAVGKHSYRYECLQQRRSPPHRRPRRRRAGPLPARRHARPRRRRRGGGRAGAAGDEPGGALAGGARTGGLLAAGLTAPHLLGPLLARRLDGARDGRGVLALAFAGYGAALGGAALLLDRGALAPAAGLVVVAGTCGPLLTGGLSSRLRGVARCDQRAERRAEGFDAITYGVAGSAGPAAVAALAA